MMRSARPWFEKEISGCSLTGFINENGEGRFLCSWQDSLKISRRVGRRSQKSAEINYRALSPWYAGFCVSILW